MRKKLIFAVSVVFLFGFLGLAYAQQFQNISSEEGDIKVSKVDSFSDKKSPTGHRSCRCENPDYFALKAGIYEPTDDLEDFDRGFNGEVAWNHYFNPNFAAETTIGYFQSDGHESGTKLDVYAVPVTVNFKGIIPFKIGEFYAGAGIGAYFVESEIEAKVSGNGSSKVEESNVIVGGQFLTGLSFDITENLFIGIEGKYIFTEKVKLDVSEFNLNGYAAAGVLGIRY